MKKTVEYIEKQKKYINCKSCGAIYDIYLPQCPYCGETNEYGDEIEYQNHLEKIYRDMGELADDSLEGAADEIKQKGKGALKYVLIAGAVVFCIAIVVFFIKSVGEKQNAQNTTAELLWERENYSRLDKMYEDGDYDGLLRFLEEFYSNDENNGHKLYNWQHMEFLNAYMKYRYMLNAVERIAKYPEDTEFDKQSVLLLALELKYENYEAKYTTVKSMTKQDYDLVMSYIDTADEILLSHLGLTKERCDEIHREVVASSDGVVMSTEKIYEIADELEWIE